MHLRTITESLLCHQSTIGQYTCLHCDRDIGRVLRSTGRNNGKISRLCCYISRCTIPTPVGIDSIRTHCVEPSRFQVIDTYLIVGHVVYILCVVLLRRHIIRICRLFPAKAGKEHFTSSVIQHRSRNDKTFLIGARDLQITKDGRLALYRSKALCLPLSNTVSAIGITTIIICLTGFQCLKLHTEFTFIVCANFHFSIFCHTLQRGIKNTVFFYHHSFCLFHAS